MRPRYVAEESGAVLDQLSGLREWHNSYAEAIKAAKEANKVVSRMTQEWNNRAERDAND